MLTQPVPRRTERVTDKQAGQRSHHFRGRRNKPETLAWPGIPDRGTSMTTHKQLKLRMVWDSELGPGLEVGPWCRQGMQAVFPERTTVVC